MAVHRSFLGKVEDLVQSRIEGGNFKMKTHCLLLEDLQAYQKDIELGEGVVFHWTWLV